jgi:mono/diheme cytochrome c family protein
MMRGLTLWAALGLALFALPETGLQALFGEEGVPKEILTKKNPITPSDGVLASARKHYADNCAQCHGNGGKGDGPMAGMLKEPPADLSDSRTMAKLTDGEIFWNATKGRPPVMPAFESKLTDEERWGLVHVLRELSRTESNNKPRADK